MSETKPKRRRGRPPIDAKITTVRLPRDVLHAIDELCGEKRRGQFIRDAVEEKLGRAEPSRAEPPAPAIAEPKAPQPDRTPPAPHLEPPSGLQFGPTARKAGSLLKSLKPKR